MGIYEPGEWLEWSPPAVCQKQHGLSPEPSEDMLDRQLKGEFSRGAVDSRDELEVKQGGDELWYSPLASLGRSWQWMATSSDDAGENSSVVWLADVHAPRRASEGANWL